MQDASTTFIGDPKMDISRMEDHETADFKAFYSFDNFADLAERIRTLEKEKNKKDCEISKLRYFLNE